MLANIRDKDEVLALAQTKTEWQCYGNKQKGFITTKNLAGQPQLAAAIISRLKLCWPL